MSKLTVFSQIDTQTIEPVKCFTFPVIKIIMKDLLRGDSAIQLLKLTETQLVENEKKNVLQDSIILTMAAKEKNYLSIIEEERTKFKIQMDYSKELEKNIKREKIKNKFTKTLLGSVIAILTILHIIN